MNASPLVTIGVTCYNAEDTIERAVASAFAQDWPSVEVIVADDASTDSSAAAVANAIRNRPNARLLALVGNGGPAASRNAILREAKGEFVAFFDDDDESLPNRVSFQVEALRRCEERTGSPLVACYASVVRRYPNGYTGRFPAIGSEGAEAPHGPAVADYLLFFGRRDDWFYGSGTPTCSLLARRSTFAALEGFDESIKRVSDVEFAVRLALAGGHFIGARDASVIQYSTESADKRPAVKQEAWLRLLDKHASYLRQAGRYDYAVRWSRLRHHYFARRRLAALAEAAGLAIRYPHLTGPHLLSTGPARLLHDWRIGRAPAS